MKLDEDIRPIHQYIFSGTPADHPIVREAMERVPITKKDQNIFTVKPIYIPMELVSDGNIVEKNLKEAGVSLEWLKNQLSILGLSLKDVFYVELQKDGTLYVDKRIDNIRE